MRVNFYEKNYVKDENNKMVEDDSGEPFLRIKIEFDSIEGKNATVIDRFATDADIEKHKAAFEAM